jgi:hypothetical protein
LLYRVGMGSEGALAFWSCMWKGRFKPERGLGFC